MVVTHISRVLPMKVLRNILRKILGRCVCKCHLDPDIVHIAPCCDEDYDRRSYPYYMKCGRSRHLNSSNRPRIPAAAPKAPPGIASIRLMFQLIVTRQTTPTFTNSNGSLSCRFWREAMEFGLDSQQVD
jgi:hypothetical protein